MQSVYLKVKQVYWHQLEICCTRCGWYEKVYNDSYCGRHRLCRICAEKSIQQNEFVK